MAPRSRAAGGPAEALRREAARGWPAGLTTLTGDDLWRLDAAQAALLEALAPAAGATLALTQFGETEVEVGAVVAAARSRPMFAPRRVVFVRDHTALDGDPAPLIEYARAPPPESYLIVRAPGLDRRLKLGKALSQAGRLLEFELPQTPDRAAGEAAARAAASERGIELDAEAAGLLADVAGGNGYALAAELDKLAAYLGAKKRATAAIVRELAPATAVQQSGWELSNAITLRDAPRALAAAGSLVDAGEHPLKILGGLAWRARVLLQARALLDSGMPLGAVISAVPAWSFKEELRSGLQRWTLRELLGFPAALQAADRTLKSSALDPRAVLEQLARRLLGAPREAAR